MPTVATTCAGILQALAKRGTHIRNLVVVLLVWGAKEAITELFFQCPCYTVTPGSSVPIKRLVYGSLFIAVPGFVLWIMGVLLMDHTWRCVTGCTRAPISQGCLCFWSVLGRSSLAPVTWAVLVFIDGTYLECIMAYTPSSCVASNMTADMSGARAHGMGTGGPPKMDVASMERNMDVRWLSGVIGCAIAGLMILIYFIALLVYHCCGKASYYQRKYAEEVENLEMEALSEAAREHNLPYFKAKWQAMIHAGTSDNWSEASALPLTSPQQDDVAFAYTPFQAMSVYGFSSIQGSPPNTNGVKGKSRPSYVGDEDLIKSDNNRRLPPLGPQEANPYAHAQTLPGYDAHSGLGSIVDDKTAPQHKKKRRKSKKAAAITPEDDTQDDPKSSTA